MENLWESRRLLSVPVSFLPVPSYMLHTNPAYTPDYTDFYVLQNNAA